jgi:hypothetical protein
MTSCWRSLLSRRPAHRGGDRPHDLDGGRLCSGVSEPACRGGADIVESRGSPNLRSDTTCWVQPSPGSPGTVITNARTEHMREIRFVGGLNILLLLVFLFIFSHELTAHNLTAYARFSRQAADVVVPCTPRAFVYQSWRPGCPLRPLTACASCATVTTSSGLGQALAHHAIR